MSFRKWNRLAHHLMMTSLFKVLRQLLWSLNLVSESGAASHLDTDLIFLAEVVDGIEITYQKSSVSSVSFSKKIPYSTIFASET